MSDWQEPIWTGNNAWVFLYESSADGTPISNGPLYQYCYFENVSLYSGVNWIQKPGFGNPVRNLETEDEWDLYTLTVGHFYFKDTELDLLKVFNANKYLYIELYLFGEMGKSDELHVLKSARASSFRVGFKDNSNAEGEAAFISSYYEQLDSAPLWQTQ